MVALQNPRRKADGLNDLAAEVLVRKKALEIYGSVGEMEQARKSEYEESRRLHREVYSSKRILPFTDRSSSSTPISAGSS